MPRNVRNFFLQIDVDGKKTRVATGPRKKDGGFRCQVLMRSDGEIYNDNVVIEGREHQGVLTLFITAGSSEEHIFTRTTKR